MTSRFIRKLGNAAGTTAQWLRVEWEARPRRRAEPSAAADPRTVLLLAWFFPPIVSGGTYRPLSFVKHGSELGWRFCVLAGVPWAPAGAPGAHLLAQVPAGTRVIRIGEGRRYFFTVDGGFVTALDAVAAVKAELGRTAPRVVIASGPPFTMFVAGRFLARWYNVPLVVDYRDEWTESPFEFVDPGRLDRWWERRCLEDADLVLFTTESQRDHALTKFSGLREQKCMVLPNGWEPADGVDAAAPAHAGSRDATIAFVGTLAEHTPPDGFLDCLGVVLARRPDLRARITLLLVGQKSPAARTRLETFAYQSILRELDQVPKDRAVDIMRSAGALLILNDPRLARYLPGKIYDYLAARRPILVYGAGGEVERLVRMLGRGRVVSHGDADALERVLDTVPADRAPDDTTMLRKWLEQHTRRQLAEDLFTALQARGLLTG